MKLLIDLRTGEPAINYDGNLEETDIDRAFNQYLDVLLRTPILEEQLLPMWGLDLRGIIQASSSANWESIIKYLIADALSPMKEPLIDSVEEITLDRDGSVLGIQIKAISKYGTVANPTVSLNE